MPRSSSGSDAAGAGEVRSAEVDLRAPGPVVDVRGREADDESEDKREDQTHGRRQGIGEDRPPIALAEEQLGDHAQIDVAAGEGERPGRP